MELEMAIVDFVRLRTVLLFGLCDINFNVFFEGSNQKENT